MKKEKISPNQIKPRVEFTDKGIVDKSQENNFDFTWSNAKIKKGKKDKD